MKTRTIIARFEIEDNDFVEQKLFDSMQCEALKDFTRLPDTDELYKNNSNFRELCKEEKRIRKLKNDIINQNLIK